MRRGLFLHNAANALINHTTDTSQKAIALPWHCLNIALVIAPMSQCFPQYRDVLRDVRLLNTGIRPDFLHQLIFSH
jgi:hypothetical protein